jgi:hypothetical protein
MNSKAPSIYDHIDGLDSARTVADLVSRLKPILEELAYASEVGDGAVMKATEQWHSDYTDALYEETADDHARGPAAAPRDRNAKNAKTAQARSAPHTDKPMVVSQKKQLPPPNRPNPGNIPPSLVAIMQGTHPSLH